MVRYAWPGNIRELENAIERAVAVGRNNIVALEDLPDELLRRNLHSRRMLGIDRLTYREAIDLATDRASRAYLIALMRGCLGSVTAAAREAGMERESLHRLLKRFGLQSESFRRPSGTNSK